MAVGDIVGVLSVVGIRSPFFALVSNPGGFFAVSGPNLIEAIDTPAGTYQIVLEALAPEVLVIQPFVLTLTLAPPTGGPSLDFSQADNSQYIL